MRGKLVAVDQADDRVRIIPARAGQTSTRGVPSTSTSDHPRACGANSESETEVLRQNGSSPRVRGKLVAPCRSDRLRRIIPARAGQTWFRLSCGSRAPDHPRACGANYMLRYGYFVQRGSSPRVRGKRPSGSSTGTRLRIIPARAGQTRRSPSSHTRVPDHPRTCGANTHTFFLERQTHGSSPRVRGKRHDAVTPIVRRRIIPARAGQTRSRSPHSSPYPDHPRACGAN